MPFKFFQKIGRRLFQKKDFSTKFKKEFGFFPDDERYYQVAFTHRSQTFQTNLPEIGDQNERLEFLGDAVLSSVVSEDLFHKFPEADEGTLTRMRSSLVSRKNLNQWAKNLGIPNFLEFDKSLETNQQFSETLYGNAFEALIGAVFLDKGYGFTKGYLKKQVLQPFVDFQKLYAEDLNYKSLLIEWSQKVKRQLIFTLENQFEGEDKKWVFQVACWLDDQKLGQGKAQQKKQAEQQAAKKAMQHLNLLNK